MAVPLYHIPHAGAKGYRGTRLQARRAARVISQVERPLLGQGFTHSHFSYLVNLARVARVERTVLTLDTGERIPVSRRYYQALMDCYIDFMK